MPNSTATRMAKRTVVFYAHYDGQPIDARHQVRVEIKGEDVRNQITDLFDHA